MAIEIGWGHLTTIIGSLCGTIVAMALWIKDVFKKTDAENKAVIQVMQNKLDNCHEKHIESEIKYVALEAKVDAINSFDKLKDSFVKGVVDGVKDILVRGD